MPYRQRPASLIHRLVKSIWGLFIALLLLLAALAYLTMTLTANRIVPLLMQQAIELRADASDGLFLQAEASVKRLRDVLLKRLDASDHDTTIARFNYLFARSHDGLWRLRPELVDAEHAPTLYLHQPPRGLTDSAKMRAVMSYDLLREQGPALDPPFYSVYMDFVEDGLMVYSRGHDWASSADADYTNTGYPTMQGSEPRNNPIRKVFWTPVYLDKQANTWMVSVIKPLDWQGQWVGTVGHDLSVQELIDSVIDKNRSNGTRLIMSAAGDLIAHPDLRKRIEAANGQLKVDATNDPVLAQVHQMLAHANGHSGASRTPDGSFWVAWAPIQGPGWFQVYLFPQARINTWLAIGLAAFIAVGILILLPAIWLLRRRVYHFVATPLKRLTEAVDTFGQGTTPQPIAMRHDDELGRLALAFNAMVSELGHQHALQNAHAQALQGEISERLTFMRRLEEESARLHSLLGAMKQSILFVNNENRVVYCNAAFLKMWDYTEPKDIIGSNAGEGLKRIIPLLVDPQSLLDIKERVAKAPTQIVHVEIHRLDGRIILHNSYPVNDAQGRLVGRLWAQEDVTHDRQVAQQLVRIAEHDALTGLYNRRKFEDELAKFFRNANPNYDQACLLFFDLDEFKFINDTHGHRCGDAVLSRVAAELRSLVPDDATLCRLGGDEFAVFMPDAAQKTAQHLAERLVSRIAQAPLQIDDKVLRMTTSLGIACYPAHANSADDLVSHADTAMYQAKRMGKNRWSIYRQDRDVSQETLTRITWNERINRALARGLFHLHYQGIYLASNGHLAHLEALIRMEDESTPGNVFLPGQFIPHAEKSGKILDIDRWVIRESIRTLALHPHLSAIAINVSGRSFDDPDLPAYIAKQLHDQHVSPKRLLVELTETSAISDIGDASRFIDALRKTGCTLCLDDFGTGFSSFAYLKHVKADVLKIDGMFIRDLPSDRDNQVFVRAIIDVARGMGKKTVAEFVEDGRTMLMLRDMGVDMLQGYHLDKPKAEHPALTSTNPISSF